MSQSTLRNHVKQIIIIIFKYLQVSKFVCDQ